MMADYLMLFSLSPVQSFISNSRKTQDLYNGSKIISDLTRSQLELLQNETSTEVIFPAKNSDFIPNRLLIKVYAKDKAFICELGQKLEKNFHSQLLKNSFQSIDKNDPIFLAQIKDYFISYWTAVEMKESYPKAYNELERRHAGIKNLRMFKQYGDGKGEQGRKCSLCGMHNSLFYNGSFGQKPPAFLSRHAVSVDNNLLKKNEAICSICALKRFKNSTSFPSVAEIAMKETLSEEEFRQLNKSNIDPEILYNENDASTYMESENSQVIIKEAENLKNQITERLKKEGKALPKYYALIMYDGDNMGNLLSGAELKGGENLQSFHQDLAGSLSENAKKNTYKVDQAGKTVYAGGDDFMGFCTLKKLLPTLKELKETFDKQVNQKLQHFLKPSSDITMSAGVVIAHYKTPLYIVLNWARKMVQASKDRAGKKSVTMAVLKHSGDIQKITWQWGEIIDKMQEILDQLKSKKFSTKFIYTLDEEFRKLDYETDKSYDRQFDSELKRLIKRSGTERSSKNVDLINQLHGACLDLKAKVKNIEDYFSLMRIIAFLYRESGGSK